MIFFLARHAVIINIYLLLLCYIKTVELVPGVLRPSGQAGARTSLKLGAKPEEGKAVLSICFILEVYYLKTYLQGFDEMPIRKLFPLNSRRCLAGNSSRN